MRITGIEGERERVEDGEVRLRRRKRQQQKKTRLVKSSNFYLDEFFGRIEESEQEKRRELKQKYKQKTQRFRLPQLTFRDRSHNKNVGTLSITFEV